MNETQARKLLGVTGNIDERELKKKYRQLMKQAHPDAAGFGEEDISSADYAVQINEAYELLRKSSGKKEKRTDRKQAAKGNEQNKWKAPIRKEAFCERPIFQTVEDCDGEIVGEFCVAKGKYLWTEEEEFSLFLKSIYQCSKKLLEDLEQEVDRSLSLEEKLPFLAKLSYNMTMQLIDAKAAKRLEPGKILFPGEVRNHRLYLMDEIGNRVGDLSSLTR